VWATGTRLEVGDYEKDPIDQSRNYKASSYLALEVVQRHLYHILLIKKVIKPGLDSRGEELNFTNQWNE
jgi:hypothetical protein